MTSGTSHQDNQTFQHLGFDDVRRWLADEAFSAPVREMLLHIQALGDQSQLDLRFNRISELWSLTETNPSFVLNHYEDLEETLRLLALRDSTLYSHALSSLVNVLEQSRKLQQSFTQVAHDYPTWTDVFSMITPLADLEREIHRSIDKDGNVSDKASPELAALRRNIRKASGSVRTRMQSLVKQYHEKGILNEDRAAMKAGRLVLPVLSSYKHQVKGIIQDQSNTGATTFIEPNEIIELNNHIKSLKIEEQREIERILKALTARLYPFHAEISNNYEALKTIDFHYALTRFGKTFACSIPKLSNKGDLHLKDARNPRLALQRKVVPLNLAMDSDTRVLVITGPNAGGKTVALKTIGLLSLMANAGIPIPAAEGSTIPYFDSIHTDIGDQQSLVNDLSTFSAHIHAIIRILKTSSENSLVLLDELGTGTDPAEGGALARAILEALALKGGKTIATTHLGGLKVYAHETPYVMNGAMEFDQQELQPTYRFQAGIPGSSYGFEISRRLGLSRKILNIARKYLGQARDSMEKLLRALESERQTLSELKRENSSMRRELKAKQKRMETALETVEKAERRADREAARKAGQIISEARQTVERVIREIRETNAEKTTIRTAKRRLASAADQLDRIEEISIEPQRKEYLKEDEITKGLKVTVLSLGQTGVVISDPSHGRVYVEADGKRLQVPLNWLGPCDDKSDVPSDKHVILNVESKTTSGYSLDIRGFRAEAAILELEKFLDQAILSNMSQVQIIHGKGTGVLKQIVHDELSRHVSVDTFHLGGQDEGGAGVTIVNLR